MGLDDKKFLDPGTIDADVHDDTDSCRMSNMSDGGAVNNVNKVTL